MFGAAFQLGPALGAMGALASLGDAINSKTADASVPLATMRRPHRETDRYSKLDQNPISIDTIPVNIPRAVRDAKFGPYEYTGLQSNATENPRIRLLEILPSATQDSGTVDFLKCKIHIRELSDPVSFEALSYTWGTHARDIPIFIVPDGLQDPSDSQQKALLVTPQLYAALRRLRKESTSRMIWIDQCCINQADAVEKGEQVQLMGKIYAKAEKTTIWLGESDKHVTYLHEMVKRLAIAKPTSEEAQESSDVRIIQAMIKTDDNGDDNAGRRRHQAIHHFLNRDWFTRVWVFQEAVFSHVLMLHCGEYELPFDIFKRVVDAVCDIEYESGGYARSLSSTTVGFDMLDLIQHRRGECVHSDCQMPKITDFLGLLLQVLMQCKATDARDLVYAFLEFQEWSDENRIKPDYNADVAKAWTSVARTIVKNSGSLDIVCAASGGSNPDLPSWVPDWTRCYRLGRPFAAPDMESSFRSGENIEHVWVDPPSPYPSGQLLVRGRIIDRIEWFSPWNFETTYYKDVSIQTFLDFDKHMDSIKGYFARQQGLSSDKIRDRWPHLEEDLMRTLLADGAFGTEQPLPVPVKDIIAVYRDEVASDQGAAAKATTPTLRERVHEWSLILQKKRIFVSGNLELGLAPRDAYGNGARPGDLIALLHGSRVPCLMRQAESADDCYQVVGQCYLNNWMFKVSAENLGNEKEQSFVLK